MASHGPEPIRVWADARIRAAVERRARAESIPAAHEAGKLLAAAFGLDWRRPASVPLRSEYEPFSSTKSRPNRVYVSAPPDVREKLESAAKVGGKSVSRVAVEFLCSVLGLPFKAPSMGRKPFVSAERKAWRNREHVADYYRRNRDEVNARRRVAALSPEAREARNLAARRNRARRKAAAIAEVCHAAWSRAQASGESL